LRLRIAWIAAHSADRLRPDHAAVQHARQPHILQIDVRSEDFARQIDARDGFTHDAVCVRVFYLCGFRDRAVQLLTVEQLAVRYAPVLAAHADRTVGRDEPVGTDAEVRRGEIEQREPPFRSGLAHGDRTDAERCAAGRIALVRRRARIGILHTDARERRVEFVGNDLCDRRRDARAQFDFAEVDGDDAGAIDRKPAVDVGRQAGSADGIRFGDRRPGRLGRRRLRERRGRHRERDHDAARLREKITARDDGHARSPAARFTARAIRRCVPQRQRLPSSA
jgi:hypothetical protein